jgi:zinc protease
MIKMENGKWKMENKLKKSLSLCVSAVIFLSFAFSVFAQETPPKPSAPKIVKVPVVKEKKLANGLTVAVVERKNVPLVTVQLLVKSGASSEQMTQAGLANMTASLLTKGTKTRNATEIAELMEFLGGSINTGAGWNSSSVTVNIMSDKLQQAMGVMSDVVLNPTFKQEELDLLKSQTLDNLVYNLKQPGFLANYVASRYSFSEHPAGGTPASIENISQVDIIAFHKNNFNPQNAVLIFTGDITAVQANALAQKFFGNWKKPESIASRKKNLSVIQVEPRQTMPKRILVVDLPNSGQASVNYLNRVFVGRSGRDFYPASVLNSVLGGGYSARLNQEIRIKRGLSYGAGSSFAWRTNETNFGTRTQTKNESAAEVAELVLAEVRKLTDSSVSSDELSPRKLVLTGDFGRDLETTQGLAGAVSELYSFDIPTSELNAYMKNVQTVSDAQIRDFAKGNILGGDLVIVGDYAIFKDDLKKRFPNRQIDVIKADELDLSKTNLRK